MIHHKCHRQPEFGEQEDHWAVSVSSALDSVLLQVGSDGDQCRIILDPDEVEDVIAALKESVLKIKTAS